MGLRVPRPGLCLTATLHHVTLTLQRPSEGTSSACSLTSFQGLLASRLLRASLALSHPLESTSSFLPPLLYTLQNKQATPPPPTSFQTSAPSAGCCGSACGNAAVGLLARVWIVLCRAGSAVALSKWDQITHPEPPFLCTLGCSDLVSSVLISFHKWLKSFTSFCSVRPGYENRDILIA